MIEKHPYFDVTFLHYGDDLRGIPQVIMQLVRLFLTTREFGKIKFIATKKVRAKFLLPLGVDPQRIVTVATVPFASTDVLFHGLFCSWRYRKILSSASLIIHGEFRTVQKSKIPQAVIYYDLFLVHHFKDSIASTGRFFKKFVKWLLYSYLRYKLISSLSAQHKITISEFTRKELLAEFSRLAPASVTALPIGSRIIVSGQAAALSPHGPISFLYVGGMLDQRKNIFTMLENMLAVSKGRPFHLHLVGKINPDSGRGLIEEKLKSLRLSESVTVHGLLSDDKLAELYATAHFFLFPSLKEGFGLPVIEAMAHGLVVCAFNNTSIPEIGGDALILSENNDFRSWGDAVGRLADNPVEYKLLSEKAKMAAEKYSEEKMFERYGKYFKDLL